MGKPSISVRIDTYNHVRLIERAIVGVHKPDSQVRSEKRSVICGVSRADGNGAPQTVEKRINPPSWRLIEWTRSS